MIKVHLVYAVKFDGRHKARLVADGDTFPEPIENIYSSVVSLRNLRLGIFLGKLNNLDIWRADIGNAYLEAFTDEKLYIVASPEFQELIGYNLLFLKVLHGLKSSGKRFRDDPIQGHMDRLKRIYSYAIRTRNYAVRFRTDQPDYSFLPDHDFDWTYSVEILPDDMPEPLGKSVVSTTTMDANLNHCLATGKSPTDAFILSIKLLLTGIQRNRLQGRQPHMVQSLLLQKQEQNRSWILGRP